MPEKLTPVARCNRHNHPPNHFCTRLTTEIETLERLGWYQEHYAVMRAEWREWNLAVWNNQWTLEIEVCHLCNSEGETITAKGRRACLRCLSEFEEVAWHPTGMIRPRVKTLLNSRNYGTP